MRDDFYNNNNEEENLNKDENLEQAHDFTLVNSKETDDTIVTENSLSGNQTLPDQTSSEYNYWKAQAEEQTTSTEQVEYAADSYNYNFNKEEVPTEDNGTGRGKKKKNGFGRTLGKTAAIAAVFGLVSGGIFQAVNLTVSHFNPTEPVKVESTKTSDSIPATTTASKSTNDASVANLVDNAMPSIVSITSTIEENVNYFGQNLSQEAEGSGSGIIVGKNNNELLIATNNHVIDGAKTIAVCFIDNEIVEAEVKGTDSTADLAIVAVNVKDIKDSTLKAIKVATLGNSDDVKVGEMSVAIGNALGYGQSVTVGYISAKERQVAVEKSSSSKSSSATSMKLLQTDAAINPGNSGGALLNLQGEVIGINSVKYASTEVEGMGYSIPISSAIPIINDLMNREVLTETEKGYLGITGTDVTENNNIYNMPTGVYVYEVAEGSAAEAGGMKVGDIIVKINDTDISSIEAVQEKVNSTRVGTKIKVLVKRTDNGEYKEVELTITLKGANSLDKLDNSNSSSKSSNEENQQTPNNGDNQPQQNPNSNEGDSGDYDADDIFRNFIDNFGN